MSARLWALGGMLLITTTAIAVAAAAESAPTAAPLLLWGVREGCTRQPQLEQALAAHLNRMGDHLIDCAALRESSPAPCSGADCAAQLPAECKQSPVRLLGGELHQEGTLTQLQIWLTEVPAGAGTPTSRVVQDACVNCDAKTIQELLINHAGELAEGRDSTGGMCSSQAPPETVESSESESRQVTLLIMDLGDKDRTVRAAVEPYLERLGHQVVVPRHRIPKSCVSQECLNTLAQSYKAQGVTQILTITSGPQPDTAQLFVYDTQSRRAEQSNIDGESYDETQLAAALAEAAGKLAVRCLSEHCPTPPRAQAQARPEGACAPLPKPQCGEPKRVAQPLLSLEKQPTQARRIGAGVLIGTGAAIIVGSFTWSLLSRTSLNQSLIALNSCNSMGKGEMNGTCQITNAGGLDIGGYFIGAAAITGGILLLKLPLTRPLLVATAAERK